MEPLLTRLQMAQVDKAATTQSGIPEVVLMEHAALALVHALERRYGAGLSTTRGVIVAGTGNNGGDALAAARILHQSGVTNLYVGLIGDPQKCSHACTEQLKMLSGVGIVWGREVDADLLSACDWILDGLLGTGLNRKAEGKPLEAIKKINAVADKKWIVAADLPSGLSADTGYPMGAAVIATETVTFGFMKRGLVTGKAADYVGHLTLAPIQIPRVLPIAVDTFLYTKTDARRLPVRLPSSHKGTFGHVFVYVGRPETEGAAILSCLGALRSGAGLVTAVSPTIHKTRERFTPEIMTEADTEKIWKEKNGALVVGPGLGIGTTSVTVVEKALASSLNLVLDADALTILAKDKKHFCKLLEKRSAVTVLTPHPKEASRLLDIDLDEIEKDRFGAARKLGDIFHSPVLLKGRGSICTIPKGLSVVINVGDTGLSRGGTGDLLTGILAALLAQSLRPEHAVPIAAFVHGLASEYLSQKHGSERVATVSEIAEALVDVFRELEYRE